MTTLDELIQYHRMLAHNLGEARAKMNTVLAMQRLMGRSNSTQGVIDACIEVTELEEELRLIRLAIDQQDSVGELLLASRKD